MAVAVGFAQELDFVDVEEAPVLLLAGLLVVPRLDPLPAFQEDTASFLQELGSNFSSSAEALNVEPFGVFLKLTAAVLPALGAGHRKCRDGCASRGVLHFWVFTQVSDQQKLLHGVLFSFVVNGERTPKCPLSYVNLWNSHESRRPYELSAESRTESLICRGTRLALDGSCSRRMSGSSN